MSTAKRALAWMERKKHSAEQSGNLMLFRGQTKVWPTIKPSITRLNAPEKAAMWSLCECVVADRARQSGGIGGYARVEKAHRIALLQHYLICSPVLDLSGVPAIALYFAISAAPVGSTCVVYSVDVEQARKYGCEVVDHDQFLLPLTDGGTTHRWIRQDAFSIGRVPWHDKESAEAFDLLDVPGVEAFPIHKLAGDDKLVEDLGDLECVDDDPLATAIRSFVDMTIRHYEIRGLERVLARSKTIDLHGNQGRQIAEWIEALERHSLGDDATLDELRKMHREWEDCGRGMDYQAAFTVWQERVAGILKSGR